MKKLKNQPMFGDSIFLEVNNGRVMVIKQWAFDGTIDVTTWREVKNGPNEIQGSLVMSPGEMVMLINYWRDCKAGRVMSEYIT